MAFTNRIKVEASGGTGNIALSVPVDSFVAFPNGNTKYTILSENNTWEVGEGVVSGNTLTRNVVEENSSGTTAKIDFSGQDLQVAQTLTGDWANNHTHTESDITDFDAYSEAETDALLANKEDAFAKNTGFNKNFGAGAGTVTEGNDSRLSDTRDPNPHTHVEDDITNLDKYTQSETDALLAGKKDDFTENTGFNKNFGSTAGTVTEGNDARLSDTRDPNPHTHTTSDITDLDTALDTKEDSLPAVTNTGTFLTSLEDGTRSWSLPVALHSDQTDYSINDIVNYQGQLYTCTTTHTAKAFDFADWSSASSSAGFGTQMNYSWSTSVSGDPGSGNFSVNNASPALATTIYVSNITEMGNDASFVWLSAQEGDIIGFEETEGNLEAAYYRVSSAAVSNSTYVSIAVTYSGGTGNPESGQTGIASYSPDPANKLPSGGNTGDALIKNSAENYDTSWVIPPWMKWRNKWMSAEYQVNDVVIDGDWTMVANKTTTDRAGPQPINDATHIFDGTLTPQVTSATQIIFGARYTTAEITQFTGLRLYLEAGFEYRVYVIQDPLGAPVYVDKGFVRADTTGWMDFNISPSLVNANTTFDLVALLSEQDPVPTTWTGDWNYTTPNNENTPGVGTASQANKAINLLKFNKTDQASADRSAELLALTIGDQIQGDTVTWTIQAVTEVGNVVQFEVAPQTQETDSVKTFSFHTIAAADLTYDYDTDYYLTYPSISGLLSINDSHANATVTDDAYGVDIIIQEFTASDDWDMLAYSGMSSGSGDDSGGGGEGGEVNTSSNTGSGVGLAKTKNVYDLPFKTIIAGTDITITSQENDITVSTGVGTSLASHEADTSNPHSVTAVQTEAVPTIQEGGVGSPLGNAIVMTQTEYDASLKNTDTMYVIVE